MPPGPSDAIISIRPKYAEAILCGEKTVELRRRIPAISVGTRLWIYTTLPVGAITGTAVVHQIRRGTPGEIWREFRAHAGVNRSEFRNYFGHAIEAVALILVQPKRIAPVHIEDLRQRWSGFHPPQVIARLTASETKSLKAMGKKAA